MLSLHRGVVVEVEPLTVEVDGNRRRAWIDEDLIGPAEVGDEVIVNTVAVDLELGSGGFDIVHVNLTRGLGGSGPEGAHVIKLNYSSLQHPVDPIEAEGGEYGFDQEIGPHVNAGKTGAEGKGGKDMAVLVLPLHGHLAPAAFAVATAAPGLRVGFIHAGGGALPGSLSRDVVTLRERGLISGHITAGPCYGGEREAITLAGALDAAASQLGWDIALVGPGPGILGSATRLGHGGIAALDAAHTALSLGLEIVLSPRLSQADPRPRHRGLSHHTATVLELLLAPVTVAIPSGASEVAKAVAEIRHRGGGSHRRIEAPAAIEAYRAADLPQRTMGRDLAQDELFFAAPLAAGNVVAGLRTAGQG